MELPEPPPRVGGVVFPELPPERTGGIEPPELRPCEEPPLEPLDPPDLPGSCRPFFPRLS